MHENETNWRTDAALIAILDETAAWTMRAKTGKVVARAVSLRMALTMASGRGREGYKAPALTMEPNDHIIVYRAQIERLIQAGFCRL